MDTPTVPQEMLNLPNTGLRFLFDEQQAQTSAQLLLQWCFDADVRELVRRHRQGNPMLLLSITNPAGREHRKLVPITQFQDLVSFFRAGPHNLYGRIFWNLSEVDKNNILGRSVYTGNYIHTLRGLEAEFNGVGKATLTVDVPSEFFAKEPSAWEYWWLGLWLGELRDECNLRRRRIFAWAIQAPVVGLYLFFRALVQVVIAGTLSGLLLQRNVRWRLILHPFYNPIKHLWETGFVDSDRTLWDGDFAARIRYSDSRGTLRPWYMMYLLLLLPALHVGLFAVCVFATALVLQSVGAEVFLTAAKWHLFVFGVLVLGTALGTALFFLASLADKVLPTKPEANRKASVFSQVGRWVAESILWPQFDKLGNYLDNRAKQRTAMLYESLSCDHAPATGLRPIRSMPVDFATRVQLIYQRTKAQICKPLARS